MESACAALRSSRTYLFINSWRMLHCFDESGGLYPINVPCLNLNEQSASESCGVLHGQESLRIGLSRSRGGIQGDDDATFTMRL